MNQISIKTFENNIEGQEMEAYQLFVVPMGNTKSTEESGLRAPTD